MGIAIVGTPQGDNELYRAALAEAQEVPEGAVVEVPPGALALEWPE
jgi:hypothetical protein